MKALDQGRGMSARAAGSALVSMWSCVTVSLAVLYLAGRLGPWVAAVILVAAAVGSATILIYARRT